MLITPTEAAAIKQQASAEYPNECCGVILTRGAERRIVACRNVQDQMHARDPITFPRTARNAVNSASFVTPIWSASASTRCSTET